MKNKKEPKVYSICTNVPDREMTDGQVESAIKLIEYAEKCGKRIDTIIFSGGFKR